MSNADYTGPGEEDQLSGAEGRPHRLNSEKESNRARRNQVIGPYRPSEPEQRLAKGPHSGGGRLFVGRGAECARMDQLLWAVRPVRAGRLWWPASRVSARRRCWIAGSPGALQPRAPTDPRMKVSLHGARAVQLSGCAGHLPVREQIGCPLPDPVKPWSGLVVGSASLVLPPDPAHQMVVDALA